MGQPPNPQLHDGSQMSWGTLGSVRNYLLPIQCVQHPLLRFFKKVWPGEVSGTLLDGGVNLLFINITTRLFCLSGVLDTPSLRSYTGTGKCTAFSWAMGVFSVCSGFLSVCTISELFCSVGDEATNSHAWRHAGWAASWGRIIRSS